MQKQPLLILCISFIVGIALQDYFRLSKPVVYIVLIVCFAAQSIYLFSNFYFHRFRPWLLLPMFFALGLFAHSLNLEKITPPDVAGNSEITFKINRKLNANEKNRRYEITAWSGQKQFLSVLSVPKENPELDFLHYYRAEAFVNTVHKPYSDFQFDYGKYLSRRDIYYQTYLPGSISAGKRTDLSLAEKIRQKRLETLRKIDQAGYSKRTREFTKGIILADRTGMDAETVEDFSKSGLMHILAISGSHMAIIFWLILQILDRIVPPQFRNSKIIVAVLMIWAFAVFIDYGSSVVRSCLMISVYYIFVLMQRKPDLLHSMGLAAFIILIADTHQLYDVGFQLSFLAVFGIFWFNQPLLKYLPKPRNPFQNLLVNVVSISFAAQIVTLPLVLYYFHQYSFISIPANLIVIPFSQMLIISSLLMTVLAALSLDFLLLNGAYDVIVKGVLYVIHLFADTKMAFHRMIPMSILEVAVSFILIYFLRFAILKFNIKNVARVCYFLLTFVALRFLLNYKAAHIQEILVHRYFKENIISVKNSDKVLFIMRENDDFGKIEKYVIEPYLTSRRSKNYEIKSLPKSAEEVRIGDQMYRFRE